MVREHPDPYLVLGVSPTATQAEITHAYRTRLRAHHPDTRHPAASKTEEDTALGQVLAAYDLLRDPARRADYARATTLAATPQTHSQTGPTPVHRPPAARANAPITYRSTNPAAPNISVPPLGAGPVRRQR